jgi:hypothetical protein
MNCVYELYNVCDCFPRWPHSQLPNARLYASFASCTVVMYAAQNRQVSLNQR